MSIRMVVFMPSNSNNTTISPLITTSFVSISHDEPISKLLSVLKKANGTPAVVVNGGHFKGMVSASSLLRNVDVSKSKVSSILRTAPTLTMNHSLDDSIRLMRDADVRALPIVEKEKVTGVLSARAVMQALVKSPVFDGVSASDLVSANPISVSPDDELGKALQIMRSKNVRKLCVMGKQGNIDGILKLEELAGDVLLSADRGSRGDSYKKMGGSKSVASASPMSVLVKSLMDDSPVTVSVKEKASAVLRALSTQTNPVVVVQGKGIITTQDVLNYYLSHQTQEALPISITHLPNIDAIDRTFVEETLSRTYSRVARTLKSDHSMRVVYKQLNKSGGLRAQTNVKISIEGAGKPIHAEATDWKVRLATKEACKTLENELSRRFTSVRGR